jgi:uncharacterized membrane protein YdjX (TVP38/TMEM64 family)
LADEIFNRLLSASWLSSGAGLISWIPFCGVLILAQILLVPVSPFSIYAGFTFGFWEGTAVTITAKMLSALVNFSMSRWVSKEWGMRLANRYPLIQTMNDVLIHEGLKLVILLRLCPIPFSIANYGYGLTKISLRTFVVATFISLIIPSTTLVALGVSLHQGLTALRDHQSQHVPWEAIGTAISFAAMFLVARRITTVAMKRVREAKSALDIPPPPNA